MSFEMFIAVGTGLMIAVMLAAGRWLDVKAWKSAVAAVVLTAVGIAGAKLMAFVESGSWGGRSFFGALFLAPLLMAPVALVLRVPVGDMLDMCAPAECVMLALLKVQCCLDGCCYGRVLRISATGGIVRFPSQIVECANAALIMVALLWIIHRGRARGRVYAWYMVLYGVCRFALNWLRETSPFVWGLPAGNFWALVSLAIGGAWMIGCALRDRRRA